jgi:hypothetical protein
MVATDQQNVLVGLCGGITGLGILLNALQGRVQNENRENFVKLSTARFFKLQNC